MTDKNGKLFDAAEAYVRAYDDDDRECIKTDVLNAFYAGSKYSTGEIERLRAELDTLRNSAVMDKAQIDSLKAMLEDALRGQSAPDGVVEALQRLIENGATLGPASAEDALLVARYRQSLIAPQPAIPDGWQLAGYTTRKALKYGVVQNQWGDEGVPLYVAAPKPGDAE